MARVELAPEVGDDLDRILEHLFQHVVADPPSRIEDIMRAIDVLERNPLIGRPVRGGLRELVIGRRARGYVALYRYVAELDTAFVLAIRGQKEAGQKRTQVQEWEPLYAISLGAVAEICAGYLRFARVVRGQSGSRVALARGLERDLEEERQLARSALAEF